MKKYALELEQHRMELDGLKHEPTATGGIKTLSTKIMFEPGKEVVTDFDFDHWVRAGVLVEIPYVAPRAPRQAPRATPEQVAAAAAAHVAVAPAPVPAPIREAVPALVIPAEQPKSKGKFGDKKKR